MLFQFESTFFMTRVQRIRDRLSVRIHCGVLAWRQSRSGKVNKPLNKADLKFLISSSIIQVFFLSPLSPAPSIFLASSPIHDMDVHLLWLLFLLVRMGMKTNGKLGVAPHLRRLTRSPLSSHTSACKAYPTPRKGDEGDTNPFLGAPMTISGTPGKTLKRSITTPWPPSETHTPGRRSVESP